MSVLVMCSPFPRWIRLSLPFTFFFAYQYAIVARSYVLVPLLLFSTLAVWRRSPIIVAFFLGLLGNVALHAAAISTGFAILYGLDCASRIRRRLEGPTKVQLSVAVALLIGMFLFAAWSALPGRDSSYISGVMNAATFHPANKTVPPWTLRFAARLFAPILWVWFPWVLGLIGWPLLVIGIGGRGGARLLVASLPFLLFCGAVYATFWHAGLLVPLTIGALWLIWNEDSPPVRRKVGLRNIALGILITGQIAGTAYAGVYDHYHDYSPGLKTARFLKSCVDSGGKVAVTDLQDPRVAPFQSVAIAPYFGGKLFVNQETAFWWWSTKDRTEARFPVVLQNKPSAVVALYVDQTAFDPGRDLTGPTAELLASLGYRFAASFCGTMPLGLHPSGYTCEVVFTPSGQNLQTGY
ncbi:MAG TPA: hypothetical protein VJS11_04460 [Acidobacteriaceae bacterium]|nr:hypothetical protein [Acidobacteriaceae bacterium]